jgi:hypothetical protein
MRGAGRAGGGSFKVPTEKKASQWQHPLDYLSPIGDLPVAPVLEPINDRWSISNLDDPVDAKDCAAYPASPYCDGDFLDQQAFGYRFELKSNGCETCLYTYPIIGFLVFQPLIVCNRDPNCDRTPPPPPFTSRIPKDLPDVEPDEFTSPECAARLTTLHRQINEYNTAQRRQESIYQQTLRKSDPKYLTDERSGSFDTPHSLGTITTHGIGKDTYEGVVYGGYTYDGTDFTWDADRQTSVGIPTVIGFNFKSFKRGGDACPPPTPPPPIIPPPPNPPESDKKVPKKRGKDMCCNDCADAKDNTDRLIKELKEIKKVLGTGKLEKALNAAVGIGDESITAIVNLIAKRIGTSRYPIEVPESLLTGVGDKTLNVESQTDYLYWLTHQLDALVGEFPIKVEVKDIDPLKEGDQKKTIELPNIAESIAEIYGLTIKSSVNQEVELNMLLRLAAEIVAVKNGVVVTQDYARANAGFLGYKGNYKARELVYNFDFGSVDLSQKGQTIVLEKLLKTVKGFVQGWELEDKETAVGFLQKLMFSAGIIKAVFFRGKKLTKQLNQEATSMANDASTSEKDWKNFLTQLNNPNSMYNADFIEKPEIKEEPKDPRKP